MDITERKITKIARKRWRAGQAFPIFGRRREVKRMNTHDGAFRPDRIGAYFRAEWRPLALVTVSGLVYNVGLLAAPWFEGRLAQCLADILGGRETAARMAVLVLAYILVTLTVQAARFVKRFYVRRFANNINRRMKGILCMPIWCGRAGPLWSGRARVS